MANSTVKDMGVLHGLLARELKSQITDGTVILDKEGNAVKISCPASILNVARQFLRDNNIECMGTNNEDIKNLVDELPFNELPTRPN